MASFRIVILVLYKICSAQAVGNPEPLVVSVKVGESVTINCTITDQKSKAMFWFKQRLEHMPLEVGFKHSTKDPELQNPFRDSKSVFQLNQTASGVSLIIKSVSKEDEGMYFCGEAEQSTVNFSNGTFLAVSGTGHSNISVDQTPELESVSSGESVTLQCTVLSEVSPEDLRVLWFRSAAGRSFPEIIYTDHSSSSRQCETSSSPHSCVYNFSKNILNDSDAGTYYCAVTTCGKIIIGSGTKVYWNPPYHHQLVLVLSLGLALGLSLFWNITLTCWSWRRGVCSGEFIQMNQMFFSS
ncbi:signal-regulatory protein beta-2-like [Salminus brasiliensis]|uniref:signal-regulatory protein beta-2-like n=1 Tax=Salminus brasiliensis TaxID=930266 RepID=UPI003B836B6E